MRKLLVSIVICSCVAMLNTEVYSQDDSSPFRKTEFGFNCTALISNLMPFENPTVTNANDALLIYKRRISDKNHFFRAGMQLNYQSAGNSSRDLFFNLKLGVEKKRFFAKHWVMHSGLELFGSSLTSEDGISNRGEFGAAGIIGFQWMINERMGLGTEGYITLSYVQQENESAGSESKGINSGIVIPRSLVFSVYF